MPTLDELRGRFKKGKAEELAAGKEFVSAVAAEKAKAARPTKQNGGGAGGRSGPGFIQVIFREAGPGKCFVRPLPGDDFEFLFGMYGRRDSRKKLSEVDDIKYLRWLHKSISTDTDRRFIEALEDRIGELT